MLRTRLFPANVRTFIDALEANGAYEFTEFRARHTAAPVLTDGKGGKLIINCCIGTHLILFEEMSK